MLISFPEIIFYLILFVNGFVKFISIFHQIKNNQYLTQLCMETVLENITPLFNLKKKKNKLHRSFWILWAIFFKKICERLKN